MYLGIDATRCTGCRICEVFCSFHHEGQIRPARSRILVVRGDEPGQFTPVTCRQCEEPLCAAACADGAILRNPATGAMEVNTALCVGCRLCLDACRFSGMAWHEEEGVPIKCDLCGGQPECVKMCPTGALENRGKGGNNGLAS